MDTKTKYILVGLVIIIIGLYFSFQNKPSEQKVSNGESQAVGQIPAVDGVAGVYTDYSPEKLASAEGKDILLFFHATWCEECHELNKNINEHLNEIPENVLILKVDYDTSTELKKKYGITHQYTLVQVDTQGNMIKKFSGSPTLAKVLAKIQ
jgi:thioredoxin 1